MRDELHGDGDMAIAVKFDNLLHEQHDDDGVHEP